MDTKPPKFVSPNVYCSYLHIVESAGMVFGNLVTDPTRVHAAQPETGILFWVSDPVIKRDAVREALRTGATGDARDLLTVRLSLRPLQAVLFRNVPGFLFFRPLPEPNAPKVVDLGLITGD